MSSPIALDSYVEGLRQRRRAAVTASEAWQVDAEAAATRVCDVLVRDFGAKRVVLFGSVARGEARVGSDLDMLVDGIAPAVWFDACAAAAAAAGRVDVDLVPREACRPYVLERALAEGRVLHG